MTAKDIFLFALVIVLYAAATVHAGIFWHFIFVTGFQDNGATPAIVPALTVQPVWFTAVEDTMGALNSLITDCLFVSQLR